MNIFFINEDRVTDANIQSGSLTTSHALAGETLEADHLTVTLYAGRNRLLGFIPKGKNTPLRTKSLKIFVCWVQQNLQEFLPEGETLPLHEAEGEIFVCFSEGGVLDFSKYPIGAPIRYYADNVFFGRFFLQKLTQISKVYYQLDAQSAVGVLESMKHYGGMYEETPAGDILAELLSGFSYTLDPQISKVTITGYLPIASKRDNLQQVLFAIGGAIFPDENGGVFISFMSDTVSGEFLASRCFIGGEVEEGEAVDGVELTEHNFFPTDEEEVLYEDGVNGEVFLEFSEPYHDFVCEGGTIVDSGVNFCKVSSMSFVTLTGKKYMHVTRVVTAGSLNSVDNAIESISDAYLANPIIAQTLANRIFSMLSHSRVIRQDILLGEEKAGDLVSVINPYTGMIESGVIRGLDIAMSGVNKGSGEFLLGYVPEGVISGYQNYVVLTGTGRWEAPNTVGDTLRAILIGGGMGGEAGASGEDGAKGKDGQRGYRSVAELGEGGVGGIGGEGGTGGKIYEVTIGVRPGDSFTYACGEGGEGGNTSGQKGRAGTDTFFGNFSSASGRFFPYGYEEKKTGGIYGLDGKLGENGADGGGGGIYPNVVSEVSKLYGADGHDVLPYIGGKGTVGKYENVDEGGDTLSNRYGGGGGGGAAKGSNGGDGGVGDISSDSVKGGKGGDGGKGSDGDSSNLSFGSGGNGGNGGGGGGGGGEAFRRSFGEFSSGTALSGDPGKGGLGGKGGKGGDGAIILYF